MNKRKLKANYKKYQNEIKNPIKIFNYNDNHNHILNDDKNNNNNNHYDIYSKELKGTSLDSKKKHKETKINNSEGSNLNYFDKKFPGYYCLIHINANNEDKNDIFESKYILDNYNYDSAIKYEQRNFFRINFIILLSQENIINTFFFKSPLEIQPLRLSLFIVNYFCDFALNALFYLNQNISDKYHYKGKHLHLFTLINNLTISLISSIFSFLLVKFLAFLINSKDSIEKLFRKQENIMRKDKKYKVGIEDKKIINEGLKKIYKILKIKIIIYIILELLFILFFLYYITAFCEVFKKIQVSWLYDSLISFLISIPIELFISFIYTLMYIISIKYQFKVLYNIVLFLYGLG